MSVQNSTDLLQMSLSTLCLNKTKYDPSRHMRNLNLLFGRGIVWLLFLFENEMNEIGVCENDKNRANYWFLSFELSICLITLI